jgi:hypothetical protein
MYCTSYHKTTWLLPIYTSYHKTTWLLPICTSYHKTTWLLPICTSYHKTISATAKPSQLPQNYINNNKSIPGTKNYISCHKTIPATKIPFEHYNPEIWERLPAIPVYRTSYTEEELPHQLVPVTTLSSSIQVNTVIVTTPAI